MCNKNLSERIKNFWIAYWFYDYLFVKHCKLKEETKRTYRFDVESEEYLRVMDSESRDVVDVRFVSRFKEELSIPKSKLREYCSEMFDTREEAIMHLVKQMLHESEECRWKVKNYPILINELLKISNKC